MSWQPICHGGQVLRTKKAARERAREILNGYSIGETLLPKDLAFMLLLFERHPEFDLKRGCGIASVQIESNWNSRGFWITRVDGSRTDISYRACLSPPTHEQNVRNAMRTEIRDQIWDFRKEHLKPEARCSVTDEPLTSNNVHVDHKYPFEDLLRDFLAAWGLSADQITIRPTFDKETDTLLADRALAAAWQKYHGERAELRLVTRYANLHLLRRKPESR